jgi:N-acetylmuramoyl-L-alanine amidase
MRSSLSGLLMAVVLAAACGAPPTPATAPAPRGAPVPSAGRPSAGAPSAPTPIAGADVLPAGALPSVPLVDGPLDIRIQYPPENYQIPVRDSNFIFGSIGSGRATLTINGVEAKVYPNGAFMGWLPVPPSDSAHYTLIARRDGESAVIRRNVRVPRTPSGSRPTPIATRVDSGTRFVELVADADAAGSDTDQVVIVRPTPAGTYKWFLFPKTVVQVTGHRGNEARIRFDSHLEGWVAESNTKPVADSALPVRVASTSRVTLGDGYSDLRVPVSGKVPYEVSEQANALVLTLFNTVANTDIINLATLDPMVRDVTWEQTTSDRARFTVHLRRAPYGYHVFWDRGNVVLRVRHAPRIDANAPLRGRTIVVDPGHPPVGSTGPTGLYEGDATLMVGEELKTMLEAAGARVVMTRTTRGPVALNERPVMARRSNGDAFVSIHFNALADGANPFRPFGSGTFYFLSHSQPLARAVQNGLVHQMGLRDMGINYDNLAVVRQTWMPAVLCEGAFIIVPEQEAALRTVGYRQRYARGILEGLTEFFRGVGR